MRTLIAALSIVAALAVESFAGDAVVLVQERRAKKPGKKPSVEHVALVKNTSSESIRGLRVTVELYDTFGKLLWSKTVAPGPSSLKPGETASLSVTTPDLPDYKKSAYRFEYRADGKPPPQRGAKR